MQKKKKKNSYFVLSHVYLNSSTNYYEAKTLWLSGAISPAVREYYVLRRYVPYGGAISE